jgi:hypothetical protein
MMETKSDRDGGHLDELTLDSLRAGEGTPEDAAHAETCPRCRVALAGMASIEIRLKQAQPRVPEVPQEIEARIFQGYRQRLGRPAPAPFPALIRRWTLPAAGLAAAGIAALALRLVPPEASRVATPQPSRMASTRVPATTEGLEAPQAAAAVDIVDAFRLARALRDGRHVAAGWDVDGDGTIGSLDVASLAHRAVAL